MVVGLSFEFQFVIRKNIQDLLYFRSFKEGGDLDK